MATGTVSINSNCFVGWSLWELFCIFMKHEKKKDFNAEYKYEKTTQKQQAANCDRTAKLTFPVLQLQINEQVLALWPPDGFWYPGKVVGKPGARGMYYFQYIISSIENDY